jgi:photosynthetic reaction center H subunit
VQTGALTEYVDVAQVVLYAFWIFFTGLIIYLRREDKREGYPLESDRSDSVRVQGWPSIPAPKVFALTHGGTYEAPSWKPDTRAVAAQPAAAWPGAPLEPTGNPMLDGVGPAAYADRADKPELTFEGAPKIVPMRVATEFSVEPRDPDPRGWAVVGADGELGGTVRDLWVDRSEPQIRYLEVEVSGGSRKLLPLALVGLDRTNERVKVNAILASQFADVPAHQDASQVTQLEEDRIGAYYASGYLYAVPSRGEAWL